MKLKEKLDIIVKKIAAIQYQQEIVKKKISFILIVKLSMEMIFMILDFTF